jgi:hypothetical protein
MQISDGLSIPVKCTWCSFSVLLEGGAMGKIWPKLLSKKIPHQHYNVKEHYSA